MPLKPWLAAYSPGVPAEIDPDRYPSLVGLLEASFERFAAQPAFTNLGTTMTYGEVERLSRAFAAYLQSLPGLRPGDRVAIMVPNSLQSPVVLFGILSAGMVAVNVNPMYTYPSSSTSSPTAARASSSSSRTSRTSWRRRCRAPRSKPSS